jgi:outer membrane biosynthesis protein TonB
MNGTVLTLSLIVILLWQSCETIVPPAENTGRLGNETNHTIASSSETCDFSQYASVRIGHFDKDFVLKQTQPEYPAEVGNRGVHGRVVVKALINRKGDVEKACAVEGETELRLPAENAALKWKFKPGYGIAFKRPTTPKNPRNYAEVYIVFDFKPPDMNK